MKYPTWLLPAWLAGSLLAGEFAPPAEGPVAFRRDRVPLEADAMAELSRQLATLARGLNAENATDRRGAAQMLALALALDPANSDARGLISRYGNGTHAPDADAAAIERGRSHIWQLIAWLDSPQAGTDGRALAGCLKDVITLSDPKHPQAAALRAAGGHGAWTGWIPPLEAYEKPVEVVMKNEPAQPTQPETPAVVTPRLAHAEIYSVLWQRIGKQGEGTWSLQPAALEMNAKMQPPAEGADQPPPFSIAISNQPELQPLPALAESIRKLLRQQHGQLPRGMRVRITATDLEQSIYNRRHQTISAAVAVLADSAITGRTPQAMVLGVVDQSGTFKTPAGFWDQLRALGKGDGRRLILPASVADSIPSMLALERPEFFFHYEVLLARDFKQLVALATRGPDEPEPPASAKFREIRERAGTGDIRTYLGNSFVKQRLAAVLQEMPDHLSAKMLLLQASGNRPVYVSRAVAAAELRRIVAPIGATLINAYQDSTYTATNLGDIYDSCRSAVDNLERYVEKNDRPLIADARETVIAVRTLDRASRTRNNAYNNYNNNYNTTFEARKSLNRRYWICCAASPRKPTARPPTHQTNRAR